MRDDLLIEERYEKNSHLFYPKMADTIKTVMNNPEIMPEEIIIDEDFLYNEVDTGASLLAIIKKIRLIAMVIWEMMLKMVSESYRESFNAAVVKIANAYSIAYHNRINEVYRTSQAFIKQSEKFAENRDKLMQWSDALKEQYAEMERLNGQYSTKQAEVEEKRNALEEAKEAQENIAEERAKAEAGRVKLDHLKKSNVIVKMWHRQRIAELKGLAPVALLLKKEKDASAAVKVLEKELQSLETEMKIVEKAVEMINGKTNRLRNLISAYYEYQRKVQKRSLKILKRVADLTDQEPDEIFDLEKLHVGKIELHGKEVVLIQPKKMEKQSDPHEKMRRDIRNKAHAKLSDLWITLMNKINDNVEWRCDANGKFEISLSRPAKVWVDSEKNRGGAVLLIGYNPSSNGLSKVTGRLSKGKMEFSSGYYAHCEVPVLGLKTPKTTSISITDTNTVTTCGTLGFGMSGSEKLAHETLKRYWDDGRQIDEDHNVFLEAKISCEAGLGKNG
ncbi:MAG: hypothetical protein H7A37_06960 [Chlamydiales bacterium]|nr:hypothetical protein [Chlamydiia bacterium]MCP5508022.1 hypothetical protein [Chlamydiales bacterium]